MCLRCLSLLAALAAAGGCAPQTAAHAPEAARELRVCADPNNLPFSNERREGFENRLAELVAADMGAEIRYTWWAQRRGFVRNTVRAGSCDVVMGVPAEYELLAVTRPYYRSGYVFLFREGVGIDVDSLDHPALRTLRIGVHVIGDDYANPPPAHALARRQIVGNVVGYSIFGDYREPNPPARLVEAALDGALDIAIVWGPFAGYFAAQRGMVIAPVPADPGMPTLPLSFDIAVGVSRERPALRAEIDGILERRADDIDALLERYQVPRGGVFAAPPPL